ncbi:PQQ-binding-like beta-propeller repeat protein [Aggregicoccus sp. 17bor-14]|uniref:outer membrane protein assembly factor BamB family protein n=1 Tax=Myxococcaceae TaxID=31 RepID=UPI00129D17B8|nr:MULTISPECIES: PQQ-binding-like beta-propeller repeat protein [Myxococcaceae]MBF5044117.1 PQQ-binding-like beta-propeller repeat protein [Simulacricoccus sp. 17bor-14]MRI89867.1 PQQ-binding-like beta-propeller repeat protein [Aggregicoccus sp. 17bor-14]
MIRIRIGQHWRREPGEPPMDSVGLELDGVNLLPGAVEEPLAEVVPALSAAVAALHGGRAPLAQVSLPEAHLELVLQRDGGEVLLQVAALDRPARRLRPPVRVDLEELAAAVRAGGEALPPEALPAARRRLLEGSLALLRRAPDPAPAEPPAPYTRRVAPPATPGFGLLLEDGADVLRRFGRQGGPALGSLLCEGEVWLELAGRPQAWRSRGAPFLAVLELSRQGSELVRALELGEAEHALEPAGTRPALLLELAEGRAQLGRGGPRVALEGRALAAAMLDLGLAFVLAVTERHPAQAKNPYLVELSERCRDGLSHLRGAVRPPEAEGEARERVVLPRAASRPLRTPGRLKRLRFEKLWEQRGLAGAERGQLLLHPKGPVYSAPELACAFAARDGALLWRREASHGVAAAADGHAVVAEGSRVYGFKGRGAGARWLHAHDGTPLGPSLVRKDGVLVASSEGRAVLGFAELSGRELWRLAPPRTQRVHLSVQAHRALLATDLGYLYGLDLADGQVRFRVRAELPFVAPPVPWGRRFAATLGQGLQGAVLVADAHAGEVAWTALLPFGQPTLPLPRGAHLYVAGQAEGEGALACLGTRGQLLWERGLHLGPGPYALTGLTRSVVVAAPHGGAARFGEDGRMAWRVGASGEPLSRALRPVPARGVVFLPGEQVRAVEPRGGHVLAEVEAGAGLVALEADAQLNLYLLDDAGTLSAYRLATHLAVVAGGDGG